METQTQTDLVPNTRPNLKDKVFCSFSKMVSTDEIKEHPKNANRHGREQVEILANAIKATGWRTPIGVSRRSGYIIRGHGRFAAAKALGLTQVPVDFQEYETEAQELADLLGDNKIADLSEIDYEGISNVLKELPQDQLFMTGFRDFEISPLIAAEWAKPALCEVPEFTAGFKFSCSEEENQTIRKAIKVCQSKTTETLTDGKCLEIMATQYLTGVITQESRLSQDVGPAAKSARVNKEVIASQDKPAKLAITEPIGESSKVVEFTVKYVAETSLNETDVTVVKSEETGERYHTIDADMISLARGSILAKPQTKLRGTIDTSGKEFWVTKLETVQENANVK